MLPSRAVAVLSVLALLGSAVDAAEFTLRPPLGLQEQADLVAFLEALTGEIAPEVTSPPQLPR